MVDKAKLNSLCMVGEVECFVQPVENDPSVLVLGAGHVSRAITDLLLFIGCRVTVVDDRPEYVVPEFFDERVTRKCLPLENFKKIYLLMNIMGLSLLLVLMSMIMYA